jgi:hypothetical protein
VSEFPPNQVFEIINKIQRRYSTAYSKTGFYTPGEYEKDVTDLLEKAFPFARVSGPRLFNATTRLDEELGVEVDNLLHFRKDEIDYIIIVEAKKQKVANNGNQWIVTYADKEKCAAEQIERHIRTLWEYIEPISRSLEVRFLGIVCSAASDVAQAERVGYRNSQLHLVSVNELLFLLNEIFNLDCKKNEPPAEVLRVSQSGFLDLLRLSLPVSELGHPELSSAIRYVERCRRALDASLFSDFKPTVERWAINGSAGMGKSVLLGYAAAVFCSGYQLATFQGETFPIRGDKLFGELKFEKDSPHMSVCLMAMSAKQLENLKGWFEFFVSRFKTLDKTGDIRFRQPDFVLCRDVETVAYQCRNCSVLLVDEAHDLPSYAAKEIAKYHIEKNFYLVVACDRHQKLRLSGSDTRIVEGLDFSHKSRRLKQIYRNPAPIYIVSLAIMFRWFAKGGPKVLPSLNELRDSFGFEVTKEGPGTRALAMRSDAHPANSWCHTVSTFPNADAAFNALSRERMGYREVLWVRFSDEDPDFDYEKLRQFTYHNCRSYDAQKISDKYVKGQEYPIVVIEGFPSFMDRHEPVDGANDHEIKMWAFRREVYLCASRATSFLYFVCNPVQQTPENARIKEEIQRAVDAVSVPEEIQTNRARTWKILVQDSGIQRKMDVFEDATPSEKADEIPSATKIVLKSAEKAIDKSINSGLLEKPEVNENLDFSAPVIPKQVAPVLPAKQIAPVQSGPQSLIEPIDPPHAKNAARITEKSEEVYPEGVAIEFPPKQVTPLQTEAQPLHESSTDVVLPDPEAQLSSENVNQVIRLKLPITPKQIADELGVKPFQVIKNFMQFQVFTNLNASLLDADLVKKVFQTFGAEFEQINPPQKQDKTRSVVRVVTAMGPIDIPHKINSNHAVKKAEPAEDESSLQKEQGNPDVANFSDVQYESDNSSAIKTPTDDGGAFKYSITVDGPESVREVARKLGVPSKDVLEIARERGFQHFQSFHILDLKTIQFIASKSGFRVKTARDIARL